MLIFHLLRFIPVKKTLYFDSKQLFATGVSKSEAEDEKKRQREEKRLARQKEIEAKRAAKKTGAMKLGSKLS